MILQALKQYYDRKAENGELAPEGWIQGEIDFLIELDASGNYLGIQSLQGLDGKKKIPKPLLVPNIGKQSMKHTNSGKDANLLWDNASFVLGRGDKGDVRLQSMIQSIDDWIGKGESPEIDSIRIFLERGLSDRSIFSPILNHGEYGESISSGQPKISFHIMGSKDRIVFDSETVKASLRKSTAGITSSASDKNGICLITGDSDVPIELTHTVIKGVWGSQTSGACIVSFNKDKPAFESYGKIQSYNAPVSKKAASEYIKSLNYLLGSDQCLHISDTSTVFWSVKKTQFESDFSFFFNEPNKDDPDAGTRHIKNLFEAVNTGAYVEDRGDEKFFVLGLAPNAARIAIRFWQTGTVNEFAERTRQHFKDLNIIKPPNEPEYYSLWRLLVNIATLDKSENIPPNIAGDFMRSILDGTPYPETLLQAALRRIRNDAKDRVKPVRAALIKAYLNRYLRAHLNSSEKEITMALDTEQPSIGYQLGRLFAVLEKIQGEANGDINATIRDRFYGSACSSPVTVFGTLMRLKNHHLSKLANKGRAVNLERLVCEIVGHFNDFPPHLDLHEQGKFAIGYYHQRQHFFTKKA
ncbi:MAG: type I-C CRISPR-associated protein Cas8c/Csd1 [Rectinema sp.]